MVAHQSPKLLVRVQISEPVPIKNCKKQGKVKIFVNIINSFWLYHTGFDFCSHSGISNYKPLLEL